MNHHDSRFIPATVTVEVAVAMAVGRTSLAVGEVLELVVEVFEGCVPHLGLDAHNIDGWKMGEWVRINRIEVNSRRVNSTEGVNE